MIIKIVTGAGVTASDTVVEIGPGLGDMTSVLAERAEHVIAVEIDRRLIELLKRKFENDDRVEIVGADALSYSIRDISGLCGKKIKIVANLPYNISAPLLFKFFSERNYMDSMTLMFQKEVALRIIAVPGTKDYGVLSVYSQLYTEPRILFSVMPHMFTPPPRVESAVVRFDMLPAPRVAAEDENLMLRIVKAAFGQRRKTLLNALSAGLNLPKEDINTALEISGVDGMRRGETLSLTEFCALSNAVLNPLS